MNRLAVIPTQDKPTRSSQVARYLLDLISREHLRPGDTAPSEIQICRALQVSRGSVREAYRTLAALGVLEIESGKRPRLQPLSDTVMAQVFGYALTTAQVTIGHVVETRRAIEVQSAQLAARHANEAQKKVLRELVAQMRSALHDHARRMAADMALHTVLAEASGNPLNALLLDALRTSVQQSMTVDLAQRRGDADLIRIIDAHESIVDRVCAGDAVGAGAAMACHFDLSVATLVRAKEGAPAQSPAFVRAASRSAGESA